jgi:hypothetical protein
MLSIMDEIAFGGRRIRPRIMVLSKWEGSGEIESALSMILIFCAIVSWQGS